jgi:hypothetical protein
MKWKRKNFSIKFPKVKLGRKKITVPRELRNIRKNKEAMKWIEFVVCLVCSLPDYIGAALPIVGDVWDIATFIILGITFQSLSVGAFLLEFLPVVWFDLAPLEFAPWIGKYYRKKKKKKTRKR